MWNTTMGRMRSAGAALTALVLLAGCASQAEQRVRRAIDAVGGIERLAAVQEYAVASEQGVALTVTVEGQPAPSLPAVFLGAETFRRPASYHAGFVGAIFGSAVVALDTVVEPGRAPARSLDQGAQWSDLDHVEGPAARLRARVEPSLLLPDLLLADDVDLRVREPVPVSGTLRPALTVRFGDLAPVTYVFDPVTGRIDRVLLPALAGVEVSGQVVALADWRDVEGVLIAHERRDPRPGRDTCERIVSIDLRDSATDAAFVATAMSTVLPALGFRETDGIGEPVVDEYDGTPADLPAALSDLHRRMREHDLAPWDTAIVVIHKDDAESRGLRATLQMGWGRRPMGTLPLRFAEQSSVYLATIAAPSSPADWPAALADLRDRVRRRGLTVIGVPHVIVDAWDEESRTVRGDIGLPVARDESR